MKRILVLIAVSFAVAFAGCARKDAEAAKDEPRKEEGRKDEAKKEAPAAEAAPAEQPAPAEQAEKDEPTPDGAPASPPLNSIEEGRTLLSQVCPLLGNVRLAMTTEFLESVGAIGFGAFGFRESGTMLLFYLYEYPDAAAALAGAEELPARIATLELKPEVTIVANGNIVLVAGVSRSDTIGEAQAAKLKEVAGAFAGKVE